MKEDDGLPCYICLDCMIKLTSFWNFKSMIIESESKLKNNYEGSTHRYGCEISTEDNEVIIKEEPCISSSDLSPEETESSCYNEPQTKQTSYVIPLLRNLVVVVPNTHSAFARNDIDSVQNDFPATSDYLQMKSGMSKTLSQQEDSSELDYQENSNDFVDLSQGKDKEVILSQDQSHDDSISRTDSEQSSDNIDMTFKEELLETKNQTDCDEWLPEKKRSLKGPRTIFCKACKISVLPSRYYKLHAPSPKDSKLFKCDYCGNLFDTNDQLIEHESKHPKRQPHICDICGKSFKTYHIMQTHRNVHMKGKSFVCEHCDIKFSFKRALKIHMTIHNNEKEYICEVCGKCFHTRSNFAVHKLSHVSKKTLPCTLCDKLFATKATLEEHLKTHSDSRPHTSNYCSDSFKTYERKRRRTGKNPYYVKNIL